MRNDKGFLAQTASFSNNTAHNGQALGKETLIAKDCAQLGIISFQLYKYIVDIKHITNRVSPLIEKI
ncbi:hypothetical protein LNQ81_17190 [Myroides sp. M-43]|uniref:hypothetical protein n=1 Tax=Myroides oncorhynchi TaxID=2893756 RepID=UPI001E6400FD|nr:hypothetical protein [Myroides oncorhynchi]MCC9044411.1 hypothetical protein [Myroides oncorhynchi]